MDKESIRQLLNELTEGEIDVDRAISKLGDMPFVQLTHARLDTHRNLRNGFGEVVFGAGKSLEQLEEVVSSLLELHGKVLVTKLGREQAEALGEKFSSLEVYPEAGVAKTGHEYPEGELGNVAIVSAGTSDWPIVAEGMYCAHYYGLKTSVVRDVGVAGLHRVLPEVELLNQQDLIIVVAGMDAALPSVLGGLCQPPIIVVPTSVGYGATFGGLAALLSSLVACSPGITVVNIDNGFGAALAAAKILRHVGATAREC